MVKIYTPPQATNDPSYLSYSKEPDRIRPDQSLGTLFENIGEVGSMAIKGIDNIMQNIVKDEANQVNDASMSDGLQMQMVGLGIQPKPGDAVAGGQDPVGDSILPREPSLPAGVRDEAVAAKNRISTMESSVRAGKYPHVQWLMEREALSRSLRARYPGYRDQIDAVLGNTANTLYAALQAETNAKASAVQAQQNKIESQLYQKSEWVSQIYADFFSNREKYRGREAEVLNNASRLEADKVANEARSKEIDLAAKMGSPIDQVNIMKRTLVDRASQEANTVIRSGIYAMGFKDDADFERRVAELKSGAAPKAGEIEAMQLVADQMLRKYENIMLKYASEPLGQHGHTPNGLITGAEVQKIVQEQGRVITLFKDAIVHKETGILGHLKRVEEGKGDSLRRELFSQYEYLPVIEQLRAITGGGITFDNAMTASGMTARLGRDAKALLGLGMGEMVVNGTPFEQIVDKWRKAVGGNEHATMTASGLDGAINVITKSDSAPQLAAKTGQSLFGSTSWFARVPVDEKPEVFRKLSSAQVADAMWKQGQQDPIHWQRYKTFMERTAKDALHRERSEIAGFQADGWLSEKSPIQLVMNPQTMQIEVAKTGGAGFTPGMNQHLQQVEFAMRKQIAPLNAMLGGLKNVYSKEKAEISPDLLNQLAVMGIRIPGQSAEMDPETGWVGTPAGLGPNTTGGKRSISTRPNDAVGSGDPLKDLILSAESSNDYNAVFGQKGIKLTDMTLDEVLAHQAKSAAQGYKSTAVGGFQFIQKTLKGLKDELGLTGTEKFDATLQNRLADALLERRGLSKFREGKLSPDAFADELAKEWAALPTVGGKSFYHGDGLNRATVPRKLLLESLRQPKDVMSGGGDAEIEHEASAPGPIARLSNWLFGSGEGKKDDLSKAPPLQNYPSTEDIAMAKEYGFFENAYAPFFSGKTARILGEEITTGGRSDLSKSPLKKFFVATDAVGLREGDIMTGNLSKFVEGNPQTAETLAKGFYAANRIPIAALGFDPEKTILDIKTGEDANVYGMQFRDGKTDTMYSNVAAQGNIVHESIHRGMKILKEKHPEFFKNNPLPSEEHVVRWLMFSQLGNVEGTRNEAGRKNTQITEAVKFFTGTNGQTALAEMYTKSLEKLTRLAEKELGGRNRRLGPD